MTKIIEEKFRKMNSYFLYFLKMKNKHLTVGLVQQYTLNRL